jgi:hypothetical protein
MQGYSVQVLRRASAIAGAARDIAKLRERSGLDRNPLLNLDFFLGRVSLFPGNQPVIVLVWSSERLEGAVYFFEKTFCKIPTGYLRGFDHLSGESSVVADEADRQRILECAVRGLNSEKNVFAAWATVSLRGGTPTARRLTDEDTENLKSNKMGRQYRLKLGDTFGATLSRFGARTRRNLRYYRKRAETELKTTFEPRLSLAQSDEALDELGNRSFRPFATSLSEWRKMDRLLRSQPGYFAVGLRAKGEWISYLSGIRLGEFTHVLLQVNHIGYARYSLSTVLRSHLLECESELGQKEINFVNGVCALFQHCCEPDTCVTFVARRGLAARVLFDWIAPRHSAPDHALNIKRWASASEKPAFVRAAARRPHQAIPQQP